MDENVAKRLEEAVSEFRKGAKYQFLEGQRLARRTAQIVRWSSAGMVVLGVGLLSLMFLLAQSMFQITQYMEGMHGHTGEMTVTLSSVDHQMIALRGDMNAMTSDMDTIASSMVVIQQEMTHIPSSLDRMNNLVDVLGQTVVSMDKRMQVLNGQMNGINESVYRITRDTGEMSRPMRMLPWP